MKIKRSLILIVIIWVTLSFVSVRETWGGCGTFMCGGSSGRCIAISKDFCPEGVETVCEIPFSDNQGCPSIDCYDGCVYCGCDPIGCSCGGCFTEEVKVKTPEGEEEIKNLWAGEEVQSVNPKTDQESTSLIEEVHEITRSAYYKIKLQDEKEVEVTGEHPLYAIQKEKAPLTFWEYLKNKSLISRLLNLSFD